MLKPSLFIAILLTVSNSIMAQSPARLLEAKREIEMMIAASGAETVSVAVYDAQSKQSLSIYDRISLHAASTMKVPVMMELFRQASRKKIKLNTELVIKNQFSSIVDGSTYQLDPRDDSDILVYQRLGKTMTVRELIERMIVRSSNLATNILIELAQPRNVMKLMKELEANDIQVRRGVEDNKAFRAGLNNTTTAYDLMLLFRALIEGQTFDVKSRQEMIAILKRQEFNEGIPAGLPSGTNVAHKTGSITRIYHDAALVFPPDRKPYVIVVLTRGLDDEKKAHQLVADISRQVFLMITH